MVQVADRPHEKRESAAIRLIAPLRAWSECTIPMPNHMAAPVPRFVGAPKCQREEYLEECL